MAKNSLCLPSGGTPGQMRELLKIPSAVTQISNPRMHGRLGLRLHIRPKEPGADLNTAAAFPTMHSLQHVRIPDYLLIIDFNSVI